MDVSQENSPTEIFKAISDPVRWNILQQIAAVDELACATLEDTLTVSKPTISYHTKILQQAGLLSVRKDGRNYYYTLRPDALLIPLGALRELAPGLSMDSDADGEAAAQPGRRSAERSRVVRRGRDRRVHRAEEDEEVVLAW